MATTKPPQDPQSAYPEPPFPEQQQEPPGTEAELQPRADHGEESYRGAGRLTDRVAVITGGDFDIVIPPSVHVGLGWRLITTTVLMAPKIAMKRIAALMRLKLSSGIGDFAMFARVADPIVRGGIAAQVRGGCRGGVYHGSAQRETGEWT